MAGHLYIVIIRWIDTPMTKENIEKIDSILSPLGDWLRFNGMSWIIKSENSAADIFGALAKFLKKGDNELVMRLDPSDYGGWADKWVDDWFLTRKN